MSTGDIEEKRRAFALFKEVVELAPDARTRRLDEACSGDAELRAGVEALLQADAGDAEPFSGNASSWSSVLQDDDTARTEDALLGRSVGAWRITGVLGRGGMGAVYAVERADGAYAQQAALKLIRTGADSPAARERFLRERQTLARLQHPHVATLLDGGFSTEGDPYFVMEQVIGTPLDRWADQHKLDLRQRVVLFLQVLDAVQYAHRNLVVHRDLKPSNLLVTEAGQVKLLDFGIARHLQDAGLTATSDRALTLEYAAPEQLHDEPITTATDLYQLGVVLYRLLSGAHPFGLEADTPLARQLQALSRDAQPITRSAQQSAGELAAVRGHTPASLARALGGNLAEIVHTCLRRNPEMRYASAESIANDLRAWLDDRPIAAVRLGHSERMRLWLRRNRLLAASLSAVSLALLAGTAIALWQAHDAREHARLAEQQRNTAQAQTRKAHQTLSLLQDALFGAAPQGQLSAQFSLADLIGHSRQTLDEDPDLDPDVRKAMQRTLANLYGVGHDWANAEALYRPGLDGVVPYDRDDAQELAAHFGNYAQVLGVMGKPKEAIVAAEQAAALRRQYLPDDVFEQAVSLRNLGDAYLSAGDNANACRNYEQAVVQFRKLDKADQVAAIDAAVAFIGLARCLNAQGQYPSALQAVDEATAFADKHGMPALWDGRAVLLSLKATAQKNLGDAPGALASFKQALDILGETLGMEHPALAGGYLGVGGALNDMGRAREALEWFERAENLIAGKTVQPGTDARLYAGYGMAWGKLGDEGKRAEYYRRALAALDGADSAPLLELRDKIATEAGPAGQ